MGIPDVMKVADKFLARRVVMIEVTIRLPKIPEEMLPLRPDPELVCVIDRMSRLMAEDHHDFFFGVREIIFFCDFPQLGVCKIEGDFHRSGAIDTTPGLFTEIEMREEGNVAML
jgi:hypothetical protein